MNAEMPLALLGFFPNTAIKLKALIQDNLKESVSVFSVTSQSMTQPVTAPESLFANRHRAISISSTKNKLPLQKSMHVITQLEVSRNYKALLNKIQHDGGYYLVQYGDKSVWINTKKSEVYLDFDRNKIPGIEMASWKSISSLNPPTCARRVQLELWLFETLWQSAVDIDCEVTDTDLFELRRWPRPLSLAGRSEALRLAAFIQAEPASVALLSSKTNYDESMIKRFLYAALLSGQVHQIDAAA